MSRQSSFTHPQLSRRTMVHAGAVGLLGLGTNHLAPLRRFILNLGLVSLSAVTFATSGIGEGVEPAEMTIERAEKLLRGSEEDDIVALLKKWDKATGEREWNDATGKYSVMAKFVEVKDKSVVLYRKDKDQTITVLLSSLDFNARIRAAESNRLRVRVVETAEIMVTKSAQEEARQKKVAQEEKTRRELEKKKEDFLNSLTPKQRGTLALAKEKTIAGADREKSLIRELTFNEDAEEGLKLLARFSSASRMLRDFAEHQKNGTLTADIVKKSINDTGGADGSMRYLEALLFGPKSTGIAFVLMDDEKLLIRLDVYLAAAKTLHPDIQESYGFRHVKEFDRLGTETYWQYMMKQESK